MAMLVDAITSDTELRTPAEVAALLRVNVQTLALWRCTGRSGLRFIRIGKSIRYRRADVMAYLEKNSGTSCAELDAAATA
ncbi:MAG: helix-turn-helix domain-containing protein [Tepidisphaeraceae bacterium]